MSLFQDSLECVRLLYYIPGFELCLFPDGSPKTGSTVVVDPIAILWHLFRLGHPLLRLVGLWDERLLLLLVDEQTSNYSNDSKKSVYHFLVACKDSLRIQETDLFSISDLYKDDTDCFIKALHSVMVVIQILIKANKYPERRTMPFSLLDNTQNSATDTRSKVVQELLETERKYIASLEEIKSFAKEVDAQQTVSRDSRQLLFSNLDQLVDFQRRFLIAMETTLSLPPQDQRIGLLFSQNEMFFQVYETFCANMNIATACVIEETPDLQKLAHLIEPRNLQSYFIKPVQRLCRYPLLLAIASNSKELIKHTDQDNYAYYDELTLGYEASKRIADRINEQARLEENKLIKQELGERIDDWKGLAFDSFGDLLLNNKFPLAASNTEREYHLFLFQNILLCCKESSSKKKRRKNKEDLSVYSVKGNIFINSINGVSDVAKVMQVFELKVFWVNRADIESFALKSINHEQLALWKDRIERLVFQKRHSHITQDRSSMHLNFSDADSDFEKSRSNSATLQYKHGSIQDIIRRSNPLSRNTSIEEIDSSFQKLNASSISPRIPQRQQSASERSLSDSNQRRGSTDSFRNEIKRRPSREYLTNNSPLLTKSKLEASPKSYTEISHPINQLPDSSLFSTRSRSSHLSQPAEYTRPIVEEPFNQRMTPPISKMPLPLTDTRISPSPQQQNPIPLIKPSSTLQTTPNYVRIKVHHKQDIFMVAASTLSITYADLYKKVEKKIKLCTGLDENSYLERFKMQYIDESGDLVMIVCDDDLVLAFELYQRTERVMVVHVT